MQGAKKLFSSTISVFFIFKSLFMDKYHFQISISSEIIVFHYEQTRVNKTLSLEVGISSLLAQLYIRCLMCHVRSKTNIIGPLIFNFFRINFQIYFFQQDKKVRQNVRKLLSGCKRFAY